MIKVSNLSKSFESAKAVDDISFEVKKGETLVLLGTSGCGKTTTLRMINLLTEPDSGEILLNNQEIKAQKSEILRRGIGYVLQSNGLFPHYTIAENMAIVPKLLKWDAAKINNRIQELIRKLSLPDNILQNYPAQLSGGQQQRVGLARGLMISPPVLLMDEPFGALDPVTRATIRKEFKNLDELKNTTIIMVTHDVQEAFELADKICLMDKGKIKQIGTPNELLFQPTNDFTIQFFKDQRFQLELKAVKMKDIWRYISDNEQEEKSDVLYVTGQTSIWELMETLSEKHNQTLNIKMDGVGKINKINHQELMNAFSKYKN